MLRSRHYVLRRRTKVLQRGSWTTPCESICLGTIERSTHTGCVPIARAGPAVTVRGMSYPSDLTEEQWQLLELKWDELGLTDEDF